MFERRRVVPSKHSLQDTLLNGRPFRSFCFNLCKEYRAFAKVSSDNKNQKFHILEDELDAVGLNDSEHVRA